MTKDSLPDDAEFSRLVSDLAQCLTSRGWTLATAESCTGGWIAKCCTDLAGSSAWFERGFVTYSNEAKRELCWGSQRKSWKRKGRSAKLVALQMAQGARRGAGVKAALSVTGIAGPDGGCADKPVGTVWFGWSLEGRGTRSEVCNTLQVIVMPFAGRLWPMRWAAC